MPVPTLAFLDGIGFGELLVIAFLSVLVFGGRLPEVMRNLGRTYAKFREGLQNVSRPLREEIQRATTLPPQASLPAGAPTTAPAPGDPAPPAPRALADAFPIQSAPASAPTHPAPEPMDEPPPV